MKTDKAIETIVAQISLEEIVADIVLNAAEFWAECPGDFCVQYVGERIVFGGTNRIVWSATYGFECDESYCTQKFIDHFYNKRR